MFLSFSGTEKSDLIDLLIKFGICTFLCLASSHMQKYSHMLLVEDFKQIRGHSERDFRETILVRVLCHVVKWWDCDTLVSITQLDFTLLFIVHMFCFVSGWTNYWLINVWLLIKINCQVVIIFKLTINMFLFSAALILSYISVRCTLSVIINCQLCILWSVLH